MLTVLILEDDEIDLLRIDRELRSVPGLTIEAVTTLGSALDLLESHAFDLIVVDLQVPDSAGIETFRSIASAAQGVPIVVLTGRDSPDLGVQAVREGAQDYLPKTAQDRGRLAASARFAVERQSLVNRLQQNAEALRKSNDELASFAHVASHDLQEPLRMVSAYCDLLRRRYGDKLDEDAREFIGFAVDGATRMSRMIRDILKFAKIDHGTADIEVSDAEAALSEALVNLGDSIRGSNARVLAGSLPVVRCVRSHLVQLFQNLIGNAIKFRGDSDPVITIDAMAIGGDEWKFSLRDNGIGIDPKYAAQVFETFRRLSRDQEGNGMGLSICRKIVERHGGKIWVEPLNKGGSDFQWTMSSPGGL